MSTRIPLLAALLAAAGGFAPLHAATYTLEPDYTQGVFWWNHLGFSTPAAQFAQGEGMLEYDPSDPAKARVSVTIPLRTLSTGVPDLDDDFRSSDFFDIARFPTATFKSTRVEKGAAEGDLKVTGELTLHGVTRPLTLEVTLVRIGVNPRTSVPTIGFDATATLMRSDFGLGAYVPQVADQIRMHIITQGAEAGAYAEYRKREAQKAAAKAAAKH